MKKIGEKRKAEDIENNSKTPPTSPQATHRDKKQNQNDDPVPECSSSEKESKKIDDSKTSDVNVDEIHRDRLSPSPEKEIEGQITGKLEKGKKLQNSTLEEKKRAIKKLFFTEMPQDFYQLYEFCKENSKIDPSSAFKIVHLKLVGPFDIMSEQLCEIEEKDHYLRHWRYFYDPPEFQVF